ncbi:phage tail tape measure protein [Novosphingobium sp.]|uniref:phage tail tape measure protein n=1 Tax=Novosphingobium sp. TaxID=1874826 RepID=UPI001EB78A0E|nr:phage tail tape measure protein [Novosphingobium sp.]MBK6801664.1 phage tail tape measure protein [Novosphingobium sp.]MBK9009967.1 phage tail tape measure protein [Novosphingobium sp.]
MSDARLNLVVQFLPIDKLSGALKNIVGLGRSGDQALRGLKREARDLGMQLKAAQAASAAGMGNVTALIAEERRLERQIAQTNQQIERQKRLNAIDGRVGRVQARGAELQSAGSQNMLAGAGMLTPFVLAGNEAMRFSSGMVDIQQKAELTNRETAQMARNILNAANAAHQLPEDMRAAVDVLAGFGLDPRQAVAMVGPIGRLGTAFKVDLADGAAAAYSNLNNLKVPIAETGRALDIMAAGGKAGAFEIKDMARYFPGLTAQMQALGQSGLGAVSDLTAALQIARRGAGTSEEAATNVQNLLSKINSPAVIRAFQKNFGVDLPAALRQAYAKGKTPMEALAEITQKATGGDLTKLGFVVEDMQAQSALRALILNMDDYRKMRDQIARGGGTVDAAFRQRELQDASVAWAGFKGQLQALAITLGTTLLPVATRFFGYLNTGIGAISRWAQANPRAAQSLISLAAGLAVARVGFGALQFAFGSILGPAATAWGWFMKFKEIGGIAGVLAKIAPVFGAIRAAALFMAQGVMRAGLMMLANPMVAAIVAIVLAIGAAAYLIWKHWDKIKLAFARGREMLGQVWDWVKDKIIRFPLLFGPMGLVARYVIQHWAGIKSAFWKAVDWLKNAPAWILSKVEQFAPAFGPLGLIAREIIRHWGDARKAWDSSTAWLTSSGDTIRKAARDYPLLFGPMGAMAIEIHKQWNGISATLEKGAAIFNRSFDWIAAKIGIFPMLLGPLGVGVQYLWDNWARVDAAFTWANGMISRGWSATAALFRSGASAIVAALGPLPGWMASIGRAMISGLLLALNPSALAQRLLQIARNGIVAFKNFFGIKSPSRLFMAMGGHLTGGLALGIDRGGQGPLRAMGKLATGVAGAGAIALAQPSLAALTPSPASAAASPLVRPRVEMPEIAAPLVRPRIALPRALPELATPAIARRQDAAQPGTRPVPVAAPAPLPRPAAIMPAQPRAQRAAQAREGDRYEIHIHQQPGEDAQALADRVMRLIDTRKRRRALSSFTDDY